MTKTKPAQVEIFTDISCHQNERGFTRSSGWGAVIIRVDRRGGIVEASGLMRNPPPMANTQILEARAIANGLHKAKGEHLIMPGERVKIWTDNAAVVGHWRRKVARNDKAVEIIDALDVVRRMGDELKCFIEVRHVKGHQSSVVILSGDHHATMNARADHLARQAVSESMRGAGAVRGDRWEEVVARYREPLRFRVRDAVARLTGAA